MKYLAVILLSFLTINITAQNKVEYSISNDWYTNKNINKPLFKDVYFFD